MPETALTSPNFFSTFSRTTSAMAGHSSEGDRSDGTKLLLSILHRRPGILTLGNFREHGRYDELRVHGGGRLRHRPGVADEVHVLVEILEHFELRLMPDDRHRLLVKGIEERMVVPG